ncbi:putative peroxiredoxin YgaF [Paraliobacillus quinghaiensis]|uniref:thioredoxin-dependent peroxiredoxin n=1 Tax=Paraliobacillus quinghaiensis TaxID=470815 RepID=A0A917TNN3_9BACI|nr:thioredoxin-dependent thiol peroxidase [Paraliobacillus quinghaiensis]GGM29706.1 putative peroxiredoxin YgaF [Paraliobacillus quinghaiensis]
MTIEIGQKVPDIEMKDSGGNKVKLTDYAGKHIVLYFYPKDSTPGCTTEACSFRDNQQSFADLDAVIIGVSPDSEESHQKFKEKHDLPFTLLVDDEHELAESFGVWKLKKKPDREYWGNERSTFIIDKNGVVQKEFREVKVDGHTDEALTFIRENLN